MNDSKTTILLTGLSGFIAKHIAARLLDAGFHLRGSVRSMARGEAVRSTLAAAGHAVDRLEFVEADLTRSADWPRAVDGCRFVVHTASPFPPTQPKGKYDLVPVARDGTLHVLDAAIAAGVERIVLTSSVVAVYIGHSNRAERPFDEADWTNVESDVAYPYAVSKTLAERAAWERVKGTKTELVAINPGFVLGPLLGDRLGTSAQIIATLIRYPIPFAPDVAFGVVDVRDVADAHVAALSALEAPGRRYLLSGGMRSPIQLGATIAEFEPSYEKRRPRWILPNPVVRILGHFSRQVAPAISELGRYKSIDSRPAEALLGRGLRTPEEAVEATLKSLRAQGHI
ncbi:MAG: NAD-dependent epimerase/dehydratase family protein [Fulvimarina manganoxydans]|uniref:NAD-dependent epimerase/dehydratase family protein n=1 Tax=Fulvimarina manganoxydans TaxID=937218 RepID=UPI0023544420|nr:NAD-dependent epimerase/dehydratase family protein [Fulvimarina manganoxydans]MCK5934316.1 NAD-dependent epimerase/dehydratase family protein [Fulvimarina manganoxydans]